MQQKAKHKTKRKQQNHTLTIAEKLMSQIDLLVESQSWTIKDHVRRIQEIEYGLPEFQRTFVWDDQKVLRLWDSLHTGYPVGQLMLWEPGRTDFPVRSMGKKQSELGRDPKYAIVDGQQRLTAIWLVLTGEIPLRYDLERNEFHYRQNAENSISLDILKDRTVQDAVRGNLFSLSATGSQQQRFAAELLALNSTFAQRVIPSETVKYAEYSTVVDIFKRVNQQGAPLNDSQICLAGISSKWSGVFRRVFELLKQLNDEVGFAKSDDPDFIILAWAAVHTGQHLVKHLSPDPAIRSKYAARATLPDYEQSWARLERGVHGLIDLMRNRLDLANFQFVKAYYPLVVAINYLAHREQVSGPELDQLTKWLLMSFIQSRYSERAVTKLREDIKATGPGGSLSHLFTHRWEALNPDVFTLDDQVLVNESFRSAYSTLLYILMRKAGASDWLQTDIRVGDPSITWHFHHIFPDENFNGERAVLRNRLESVQQDGTEEQEAAVRKEMAMLESQILNVANLAFLAPESNIRIGNRPPSDYLAEICARPDGKQLLQNQFIPLDSKLWQHDAYPKFCEERRRLIVQTAQSLLGL